MAKKVVATLKTGSGKNFTKCIKMVKSEKTGAYIFKEGVIANDQVKDFPAPESRPAVRSPAESAPGKAHRGRRTGEGAPARCRTTQDTAPAEERRQKGGGRGAAAERRPLKGGR